MTGETGRGQRDQDAGTGKALGGVVVPVGDVAHGPAGRDADDPGGSSRVAIVVGATGAVGSVLCARLARGGWTVLGVARDAERLDALAGDVERLEPVAIDVTDPAAGRDVHDALAARPLSLLVHAASAPLGGHIMDVDDETLRAAYEVKVVALVRLLRDLADAFATSGRVVAVGGNLGFDPIPDGSTAGVANAAQANLVRMLDRALAPRGVTVHTVAPGPLRTPRFEGLAQEQADRRGVPLQAVLDEAAAATSVGAMTTPDQVAWAIERLTDPEAAALAGGALILDSGRRTALP